MKIYHYKSVERAEQEIKEGTLWFAKSETLNDPLEGYAQVVWQGDRIPWEGLFKNYISSLYRCMLLFDLGVDDDNLLKEDIVFRDGFSFDDAPIKDTFQRLANKFIHNNIVSRFISFLENNGECTADELYYWLCLLHPIAWNLCVEENLEKGYLTYGVKKRKEFDTNELEKITSVLDDKKITEEELHDLERVANEMLNFTEILQMSSYDKDEKESDDELKIRKARKWRVWQEMYHDFPKKYVEGLKRLIYPDGLVSCFSADVTNSVMWGHYADEHRGVCLLYETILVEEKEIIPLETIEREHLKIDLSSEVKPVGYKDSIIKRNFFETMGELSIPQIESWLKNEDNESSSLLTIYDSDEWRNRYWKEFNEMYYTKMSSWEYEKEYRLVIPGYILEHVSAADQELKDESELEEPKGLAVKYAPDTLKGIVFGLRTNIHDKVKLLRAVKESGRNLKNFGIFEAKYDERNRKIYIHENQVLEQYIDELFKVES